MKLARQGDLLFIKLDKKPTKDVEKAKDKILAHGELTGHAHRLGVGADAVTVYDYVNAGKIIEALSNFEVTHDEHGAIAFEKGIYEVRRQREYSPEEIRRVED